MGTRDADALVGVAVGLWSCMPSDGSPARIDGRKTTPRIVHDPFTT